MADDHLPDVYLGFREDYPDVAAALDGLGEAVDGAGPLDERAARSEGGERRLDARGRRVEDGREIGRGAAAEGGADLARDRLLEVRTG